MRPYKNIFLIDDDEDDQGFFTSALNELSETVVCTSFYNGHLAFNALQSIMPDAIFLDWNMPVMNGEQFLHAIKQEADLKHIPIIIISTALHQQTINYGQALGVNDFITKPNKYSDLINLLEPFIK